MQLDYVEARDFYKQAVEYDPHNSTYLNKYGMILHTLGNSKEAIEYYTKSLDINLKVYGESHPNVARDYNNLGSAWFQLGDAQKAIAYFTKALNIYKAEYGDNHPITLKVRSRLESIKKSSKYTSH